MEAELATARQTITRLRGEEPGQPPDGAIDQVRMEAVSPLTDFSFDFQDLLLRPVAK